MAENNLKEEVIGIALDGTGYGLDGCIWGGEILIANLKEFERVGHLEYLAQPGSESAIKNPWQMAISWLYHVFGEELYELNIDLIDRIGKESINAIVDMIKNDINCPKTSSLGRLFSAVSSIIGLTDKASFEAEAELKLEQVQDEYCKESYGFDLMEEDGKFIIVAKEVIKDIVRDLKRGVSKERISAKFHNGIVEILYKLSLRLRRRYKLNKVCLSGGVFQNMVLLSRLYQRLKDKGFEVYIQGKVPANDGGLCLGQAVIGNQYL
jgi:hydrogenase maturation protein HypF